MPRSNVARLLAAVLSLVAVVTLAACGSGAGGSGSASKLIRQTFSGPHAVNSGNLSFNLTVVPSGSSTLTGPISLSFAGPFQSLGKGKLPASNFDVGLSGLGKSGSIGIVSTGTSGYVTLKGAAYQLPAATFQQLESSFSQVAPSGGAGGSSLFSKLGVDPLRWLRDPTVAGHETVGGTATTHIRAGVNVTAFLADFNTFLKRASSLGVSGANTLSGGLPAATRQLVSSIHNARVDVWTGDGDHTLRRLALSLNVPLIGQLSTLLGGMKTAQVSVNMQYSDLNQPQTITAPPTVHPYAEFQAKLGSFLASTQGLGSSKLGSVTTGAGATSAPSGASSSSGPASGTVQAYSQCLQAAGTDVTKMQSCAPLLH